MSTPLVDLPFLIVEALPQNALLLSSPTQTLITSIETGEALYMLNHESILQAPRLCSVVPLSEIEQDGNESDCLLALLGDDKELNIYKLIGLASRNVSVVKVYTSSLPKRGVKMLWESVPGKAIKTLIVGDKHGDVRSFDISPNASLVDERESKRRKVKESTEEAEGKDDDEDDSTHPPHVGHVSMLTDFLLTSFTSESPQSPTSFIITSDRDEHIRISRWGERRAGHIALRYLLGSNDAIGGLCVIEQERLKVLQKLEAPTAKKVSSLPFLISTDSSILRIWSLYKDRDAQEHSNKPLLAVDLSESLSPYIKIDAAQERNRQKSFGKGRASMKKTEIVQEAMNNLAGKVEKKQPIVICHISTITEDEDVHISFVVDGASALFTISLSKLLTLPSSEMSSQIKALDVGLPLLDYSFQTDNNGILSVWMVCDVRQSADDGSTPSKGLRRAIWSHDQQEWIEDADSNLLLKNQDQLQSQGPLDMTNSLLLYDAMTQYPKQDFETAIAIADCVAPNGLVRGGLTNFDKFKSNKENKNHLARGIKIKAREDMLRRIGQALDTTT